MPDGVVLARKTGAGALRRPVPVALGIRPDGKKEIVDFRLAPRRLRRSMTGDELAFPEVETGRLPNDDRDHAVRITTLAGSEPHPGLMPAGRLGWRERDETSKNVFEGELAEPSSRNQIDFGTMFDNGGSRSMGISDATHAKDLTPTDHDTSNQSSSGATLLNAVILSSGQTNKCRG